jgi:hypothetical protein
MLPVTGVTETQFALFDAVQFVVLLLGLETFTNLLAGFVPP